MLSNQESYYAISINERLEISVTKNERDAYVLPTYTALHCSVVTNGKFKFISGTDLDFFFCETLRDDSVEWIRFDKLQKFLQNEYQKNILEYFFKHIFEIVEDSNVLDSVRFIKALQCGSLEKIRRIPKSDLHNHVPLGGSRAFLSKLTGYKVPELTGKFSSILEMNDWCKKNVKGRLNVSNEFVARALAAFLQAEYDGVTVFAPNFALCARKDFNSYDELLQFITSLIEKFSTSMKIYPELCLDRHKIDSQREQEAITLMKTGIFRIIDVTGDESLGIDRFIDIYHEATKLGIIKKAHVGEFCDAKHVADAIHKLDLNMVQHGISSVKDETVVKLIKERAIALTICPTSNYLLSRVDTISSHPIKEIVKNDIHVSICSDDILVFDSNVSGEYLKLYNAGVLSEFELNNIRIFGLRFYNN